MSQKSGSDGKDNESTFGRRGYLKTVGASLASAGAIGAMSDSAKAAEYETITLSSGEYQSFSLGSGDTLENVLIDATASGADVSIRAYGDDWAIRNVGIKGEFDVGDATGGIKYVLAAEGNGVIENVYLGDGHADGIWKGAMISGPDHDGHIDIRNCHVARWTANACYCAGPGRLRGPGKTDGQGGDYTFENCYFENNNISHLRLAADGTEVLNCTFVNTGDVPPHPNTSTGDSGVVNSRAIYTGYGDPSQVITVRNCDVEITDNNTNGAASAFVSGDHSTYGELSTVDVDDSQVLGDVRGDNVDIGSNVGSNPNTSIPDGVPQTAEEAASGTSGDGSTGGGGSGSDDGSTDDGSDGSDGGDSDPVEQISVSGDDASTVASYSFTVGEYVEQTTTNGATIDPEDSVSGTTAEGTVAGGLDSFDFAGEILALSIDGPATVTVNGTEVNPSDYPGTIESEPDLPHALAIEGTDAQIVTEYRLEVSDSIKQNTNNGATIDPEDSVSGGVAKGTVAGGIDSFDFAGEIVAFSLDGAATVTLDGSEIDPAEYPDSTDADPTTHVLSIDGAAASEVVEYTLVASEPLEQTTANGASIDANDEVIGTTAKGTVAGGTDSFAFTGDVQALEVDGAATVTLDGSEIDPAAYPGIGAVSHTLSIEGSDWRRTAKYSMTTTGPIEQTTANGATIDPNDKVSGTTASGTVAGGIDSFRFFGSVVQFEVGDAATIVLDGNEVDPSNLG